jgi:hypothetical protein
MENIHNVSIAFTQKRYVNFATPNLEVRLNVTTRQYLQEPGEAEQFCSLMKARSLEHPYFNVAKLGAILATGGLVMLVSPTLPTFVSIFQRRTEPGRYRRRIWTEPDILLLHEIFLDDQEMGLWETRNEDILATEGNSIPLSRLYSELPGFRNTMPGGISQRRTV